MRRISEARKIRLTVTAILEPDGDGYHAFCPALKGLHIDGRTKAEALRRLEEAVHVYLDSLIREGDPIPVGPDLTIERDPFEVPRGAFLQNVTVQCSIPLMSGIS